MPHLSGLARTPRPANVFLWFAPADSRVGHGRAPAVAVIKP